MNQFNLRVKPSIVPRVQTERSNVVAQAYQQAIHEYFYFKVKHPRVLASFKKEVQRRMQLKLAEKGELYPFITSTLRRSKVSNELHLPILVNNAVNPSSATLVLNGFKRAMMKKGKLTVSNGLLEECFAQLRLRGITQVTAYLCDAIDMVAPAMELRRLRRGGRIVQVPFPLTAQRSHSIARRWIINAARSRKGMRMGTALALELKEIHAGRGSAMKKREQLHRRALTGRGNLYLRW